MNMSMEQLRLAGIEHDKWLRLFKQLEIVGAVSLTDGLAPAIRRETPGQELIWRIKEWAYAYADLREANPNVKKNESVI